MDSWKFPPLLLFFYYSLTQPCQDLNSIYQGPGYLELMNSPVLKAWGRQQLRVVIRPDDPRPGDKLRVLEDGNIVRETPLPQGDFVDTNKTNKPGHTYSVEYIRADGQVVGRSELANWSGWMYCLHENLGPRSVGKVLFPGTHNAGSYKVPKKHHTISPLTVVDRYIYTQDETVEQQLERGARYFDLRIGHYPNRLPIFSDEIWWINHDIVKIRPLRKIIQQIKSFLQRWPNEIIILDLHRFPVGFKDEKLHDELAKFLVDQFGPLLHRPGYRPWAWGVTFNELWSSPARILLSYSKSDVAAKYNFYPPVGQIWADSDNTEQLNSYMDQHIPRGCSVGRMTAVMAQLTPKAAGILKEQYGGLRGLAQRVNANVTLNIAFGAWGDTSQAVAVDYLSSTGIVSAAILQNIKRIRPQHVCN